ncbi:hypothetical protein BDZ85DRAFT_55219 [Elsinoe ampelina]|uniref:NDT80 domain-containing protein n=1 Tax=Elsinoe ampelina TaxID=302913 RepID=A0A6A6GMU9_9PEZI|nr:hypothetical protein BDZ85DRAFT_55219 [Elsinoe ampelina]
MVEMLHHDCSPGCTCRNNSSEGVFGSPPTPSHLYSPTQESATYLPDAEHTHQYSAHELVGSYGPGATMPSSAQSNFYPSSQLSLSSPSSYSHQLPSISEHIFPVSTIDPSQPSYSRQPPSPHQTFINPYDTSNQYRHSPINSSFRSDAPHLSSIPNFRSLSRPFPENTLAASSFQSRSPRASNPLPDRSRWPDPTPTGAMQRDDRSMSASRADSPQDGVEPMLPWREYFDFTGGALRNERHELVQPQLFARVEKGIKLIENEWTGYRRNYVAPSAAYTLEPPSHGQALYLHSRRVQALSMKVSAVAEDPNHPGSHGKEIELIQFTAKRDHGKKRNVTNIKVAPGLPLGSEHSNEGIAIQNFLRGNPSYDTPSHYLPNLPLQVEDDEDPDFRTNRDQSHRYTPDYVPLVMHGSTDGLCRQHCFDRLQFKNATVNNGKRRAAQQYFFLKVELWADTRLDSTRAANWELLAHLVSERLVIRGRSPNHYDQKSITKQPQPPKDDEDEYKKSPTRSPEGNSGRPFSVLYFDGPSPSNFSGAGSYGFRHYAAGSGAAFDSASPEDLSSPATEMTTDRNDNDNDFLLTGTGDDLTLEIQRSLMGTGTVFSPPSPAMENNYGYGFGGMYDPISSILKEEDDFGNVMHHTTLHEQNPRWVPGMRAQDRLDSFDSSDISRTSSGFFPSNIISEGS